MEPEGINHLFTHEIQGGGVPVVAATDVPFWLLWGRPRASGSMNACAVRQGYKENATRLSQRYSI